jgi:hypothetical protein
MESKNLGVVSIKPNSLHVKKMREQTQKTIGGTELTLDVELYATLDAVELYANLFFIEPL